MGLEGGPLMMMKASLFLLISNILGRGLGAGEGATNDDEGFFVSADFKCLRKAVWGPVMMMKDSLFLLISNVLGMMCGSGEGAQ